MPGWSTTGGAARPIRRGAIRTALAIIAAGGVTAAQLTAASPESATASPISTEHLRSVACTPGVDAGCLPTPVECALGGYNGHWDGGVQGRFADCLGGGGHIVHYIGGYLGTGQYVGTDKKHQICGTIIDGDQITAGNWVDPNLCMPAAVPQGNGVEGRAFSPGVLSAGGVVASDSALAAQAGVEILNQGGNAADAATATVMALGATRPDECGLGGIGEFLYRSAKGATGAIEFEPTAPASVTPDLYSGQGLWQLDIGHRVVGVPGLAAGVAAVERDFGSMSLAQVTEPAIRLAHNGVPVAPGLARSWIYGADRLGAAVGAGPSPSGVGPLRADHLMKLFPASAHAYLRAGALPYPPDNPLARSILRVPDLEHSLELFAKYGPDAVYQDKVYPEGSSIGRLILQEMKRAESSPYPGDAPSPWKATDLTSYRAMERAPLTGTYRGYGILAEPPPSVGGVDEIETMNILEGYDLGGSIAHSSADYVHLFAEAQKLAWADTSYLADPAFHDNPVDVLTSKGYAAQRRQQIDLHQARDYGPGAIAGTPHPSAADAGPAQAHHTTHVSVIDAAGNAAAFTCSLGGDFGSLVVAPGTGFFLNDLLDFDAPGSIDEPQPGKRGRSTLSPTILVHGDRAVLATGAAGGLFIPAPISQMISDRVDYGMDPAHAVDAARVFAFCMSACPVLDTGPAPAGTFIEDERLPAGVYDDLASRGQPLVPQGEYGPLPWVQSVGVDPASGFNEAASDPRGDLGVAAQDG